MHLQYDGSKYLGFASSPGGETVEQHLFDALTKLKLIENRQACGYSRCGRTDKGVSALGQVQALFCA
jgi:tRNA pseudouridine38/39 synthase